MNSRAGRNAPLIRDRSGSYSAFNDTFAAYRTRGPACLDLHKTERSVRTASDQQVRQPIFRSGLDQWRHYERWLGPLENALGHAAVEHH
jgi:hypothetical protein